jgi:transglutaminase-like putative cysteine protease
MALGLFFVAFLFLGGLFVLALISIVVGFIVSSANADRISSGNDTLNRCVVKHYRWYFPVQNAVQHRPVNHFGLTLPINEAHYHQFRRQCPRELSPYRFNSYVTLSAPEVRLLAENLLHLGKQHGHLAYDQLCFTLAFVQQGIRYAYDRSPKTGQTIEYPKYPTETLMEQTGDCEDQAILLAALLKLMGYDVALVILPTHVALGIAGLNLSGTYLTNPTTNTRYYYVESTVNGWLPGQIPPEFEEDVSEGKYDILPIAA